MTQLADSSLKLIDSYKGLALSIARRRCHRISEREDVEQVAMIALVKAADRYDESRGVSFGTYAWATIEGEIKRYFRDHSSPMHVNRGLREAALRVSAVADQLTHSLGRSPTMQEIAEEALMSVERVIESFELMRSLRVASLDSAGIDDEPVEVAALDDNFTSADDRSALRQLLKHLPERERAVIALRFFEQRSQVDIGRTLGISQMQVSRLLSRALDTLRALAQERD